MKQLCGRPALMILLILFLVNLLGEVDYQSIPPLLPLLAAGFNVDAGYVGRAVTAYSLSAAISTLIFGYLSDRWGRKLFILSGIFLFSAATLCSSLASSTGTFFLTRMMAGIATGAFATCLTSYVADYFHYRERGRAMGILTASYFAAAIIGIPSVVLVAGRWGWRVIYLVNTILALVLALLVWSIVPHILSPSSDSDTPARMDLASVKTVLAKYMKRKDTLAMLLASLLSSGAAVGFITYLGGHLNGELGVPMHQVSLTFLWCGLASLIGAPLSGVLSDWVGKRRLLVLGGVILSSSLAVIPRLSWSTPLFVALGLAGMAMAFRMAPLLALLTELVSTKDRGTVLALRNALSQLGIGAASLASSYFFSAGGYRTVGTFCSLLIVLSILLIILLVKEPGTA